MSPDHPRYPRDLYESDASSSSVAPGDRDVDPRGRAAARRGLARLARSGAHGRVDRDRAGLFVVAIRPEPGLEGAVRRPLRAGGLRRSPLPAEHLGRRRADAGTPDVLPRRHGQAALGIQVQPLHERRAAAPDRVGLASGRSGQRQRVRLQRQRPPDVAVARRQAALGALARRRVRHVDDARRARVVADHRRRSAHRQRPDVQLGTARRRRAPLHLVRQDDGARQLDQLA